MAPFVVVLSGAQKVFCSCHEFNWPCFVSRGSLLLFAYASTVVLSAAQEGFLLLSWVKLVLPLFVVASFVFCIYFCCCFERYPKGFSALFMSLIGFVFFPMALCCFCICFCCLFRAVPKRFFTLVTSFIGFVLFSAVTSWVYLKFDCYFVSRDICFSVYVFFSFRLSGVERFFRSIHAFVGFDSPTKQVKINTNNAWKHLAMLQTMLIAIMFNIYIAYLTDVFDHMCIHNRTSNKRF